MRPHTTALLLSSLTATILLSCGGDVVGTHPGSQLLGGRPQDPALRISRAPDRTGGTLAAPGVLIEFESVEGPRDHFDVRVRVNDLLLTARYGDEGARLAGHGADAARPALLDEAHRGGVLRLLRALEREFYPPIDSVKTKREYDALRRLTPAEYRLFRVVDAQWARWPETLPLELDLSFTTQDYSSWRRYASTSTTVTGCHDCLWCDTPDECCDAGKKLGEYFDGGNYGNCGVSDSGSQFTRDCTNHDQCVRTSKHGGHALASPFCNDEFLAASDDELFAPSCDYDWRGSSNKGRCPASFRDDGSCDCFCQFEDPDCSF